MSDHNITKYEDLDLLTEVDDDDTFLAKDVDDLTDGPVGTNKRATAEAIRAGLETTEGATAKVAAHNEDADAHGPRLPPTPVGVPDGHTPSVKSGEYVLSAPGVDSLTRSLVCPDPRLWSVYESGLRDIESATNAIGQESDSGHEWESVNKGGETAILEYRPLSDPAPMYAHKSPTGAKVLADQSLVLLPGPTTTQRLVEVTWWPELTDTWNRWLILSYVDINNILAIRATNIAWYVTSLVGGVESSLLAQGGAGSGYAGSKAIHKVSAHLHYVHGNSSAVNRAVSFTVDQGTNQRDVFWVGLPSGHEVFRDNVGKVGLGVARDTYIWGFAARRGAQ